MTKVRAIHAIQYSPNAVLVPTGSLDVDGRVRFAPKVDLHKPGSQFEIDDPAVVQRLLEAGAIEVLDSGWEKVAEEATKVWRRDSGGTSPVEPKPETWPQPRYPFQTSSDSSFEDLI